MADLVVQLASWGMSYTMSDVRSMTRRDVAALLTALSTHARNVERRRARQRTRR